MTSRTADMSPASLKFQVHWLNGAAACAHGTHCSCRKMALALGLDETAIDYNYCFHVLQRHWRLRCDHLPEAPRRKTTPSLPPHNPHDPIHVLLIANADTADGD